MLKKYIKSFLKRIKLLNFIQRKRMLLRRKHPLLFSEEIKGYDLIYLGSEYGGWDFVDDKNLENCTIISAGLGEDASFDIEFANKYNAKVIIVDPTPRAIKHFNAIITSLGNASKTEYVVGGKQPINSYDLSNLKKDNFFLVKKALCNKNEQ